MSPSEVDATVESSQVRSRAALVAWVLLAVVGAYWNELVLEIVVVVVPAYFGGFLAVRFGKNQALFGACFALCGWISLLWWLPMMQLTSRALEHMLLAPFVVWGGAAIGRRVNEIRAELGI